MAADLEQVELARDRGRLVGEVKKLVDRYRAIFDWDVPDIDQRAADRLILGEIRKAVDELEKKLAG
jgi:hypothetical protein